MVFTVRVRRADHGFSRRAALTAAVGGLAALGLGACDIGSTTVVWHPAPDVLLPFLASTIALADAYDAAIRTVPALATELTPLRDAHRRHVTALRRELGLVGAALPTPAPFPSAGERSSSDPGTGTSASASLPPTPPPTGTPSSTGSPVDRAGLVDALRTAEQKGQQDAVAACVAAPSYRAALLGSIAACRATHLTVLA